MAIYENTNLKEDYVSFETAKLLKEKGFDEPVQMYVKTYNYPSDTIIQNIKKITGKNAEQIEVHSLFNSEDEPFFNSVEGKDENLFACPTIQMAMKWLREVHKLHISVDMGFDVDNSQYFFYVPSVCRFSNKSGEYQTPFGEKEFGSYEEACEAAIKHCLENLI